MSDHGLTPVRPRTTPLEATILDQLRDLREQNRALDDRVKKLERVHLLARQKGPCAQCYHVHPIGELCAGECNWGGPCKCDS